MKQYFIRCFLLAGTALLMVPAFAQKDKTAKAEKDHQTIVITREAGSTEKTVIEIDGDKVRINGKDAKDVDDVRVNINKFKNGAHTMDLSGIGRQNWNFNMDNEAISLFSEDSNRAMLGVVTDVEDEGVVITSVSKESAAEKAGLKKGDIVTRIGSKKIENSEDISEIVRGHKPGDKVDISVLRGGKEQKISAELGKWKGVQMNALGLNRAFENFSPDVRVAPSLNGYRVLIETGRPRLGVSIQDTDDGKGVKVLDVDDDGAASKSGIREDDVITHINDKAISSADEVSRYMKENKDKASVSMKVLRGGKSQNIEVKIPRKLKTADL